MDAIRKDRNERLVEVLEGGMKLTILTDGLGWSLWMDLDVVVESGGR